MAITAASVMAEVGVDTSKAERGLQQFGAKLSQTGKAGGQSMAPVRTALGGVEGAARTATMGIAGLGTAMGVGALVGLAGGMASTALEMAKASEQSAVLAGSFDSLAAKAGQSGQKMMAAMKEASGGGISEYNLMLAANKAMMLGVADSAEEMAALLEIAGTRGRAMGLSTTQAFNDLVTGLGRGSALILDNLGIIVDADAANQAYAESVGKTVAQLTEQEKKQALVNVTLAEATGKITVVATSSERLAAAWADMKVSMGDMFGPALAAGIEALAAGARGLVEVKDAVAGAMTSSSSEIVKASTTQAAAARSVWNDSQLSARFAQATLDAWEKTAAAQAKTMAAPMPPTAEGSGLSQEEFLQVQAYASMIAAQREMNALAGTEVDIRREIAAYVNSAADRAVEAARTQSAADLAGQYEQVAAVQERFRLVSEAANNAGLSTQQAGLLAARAAEQYAILTANGYTSAQALDLIAQSADLSASAMAAAAAATAEHRAAVEAAHGAQQAAGESATGLGIALWSVTDAGWGAKGGIDAAGAAADHAQSGFWGLVSAAQAASAAMRQAQIDSASNKLEGAYMGAIGSMGAGAAYDQYQNANEGLARFAQGLDAAGIPLDKQKFLLEEYNVKAADAISAQAQAKDAATAGTDAVLNAARAQRLAARSADSAAGKLGDVATKAGDLSGKLQGLLDQVPGLTGTSDVTDKQMADAKLGIPQNFADDYLRRLTDEVVNGVDWAGVDIGDAAQRAGIDPSLPAEVILEMFKNSWADSSLFANPANLDLLNMDAVKASIQQQQAAGTGKANIMALFGIGDDATVAAVAGLGLDIQSGLGQWLSDNGMADAGSKLADAMSSGVTAAGIPVDGGLNTWLGSGSAAAALASFGVDLGDRISPHVIITPTVNMPTIPNGGSSVPGGSDLPPVKPSGSGFYNPSSNSGASVVVNATVSQAHDIPLLAKAVAREIQRHA